MWFLYILLCSDNSLYTGISTDPQKRFQAHLAGKGGHYTRAHKPIKIVYREKAGAHSDALKREAEIKRWSKTKKIKQLNLVELISNQ
jgi:putative endonuclease